VGAIGPQESRLLALERKQVRLDDDLANITRRLTTLEQRLWQAWAELGGPRGATCTATYSGHLLGCTGTGLVGYTVKIQDATSSAVLGTATTTTGGAFSGSMTITSPSQMAHITTSGISGYNDSTTAKTFYCGSNSVGNISPSAILPSAPTLNSQSNLSYCGDPGTVTVNLSGITDGNSNVLLPITVTATSSNTTDIPNPTVAYTSPNTTGSIKFTPRAGLNNCATPRTISVKVTNSGSTTCGGSNSIVRTFTVVVVQPTTPTLNAIGNVGPIVHGSANQTVNLSGIGPGSCNVSASLSVSASSSNPGVSNVVSVNYTSPHTTGSIVISIGSAGTATITVAVTDSDPGHCGTTIKSQTFTVTVV
jgi:hypothetical protein